MDRRPTGAVGRGRGDLRRVARIAQRAHAQMVHMIWEANHRQDKRPGDPKVGGHPAACASSCHILGALHLAGARRLCDERGVLLDTGGGIMRALPKLGGAPFVIHNSDSVWIEGVGSNIDRLIAAWDDTRMDALMLVALSARSIGYEGVGDFKMAAGGRLQRRGKDASAPLVFAGVSIAHPRLFDGAPAGAFSLNLPWDRAIAAGRLFGVRLEGLWMHVGTPEALAEAERIVARDDAD